MKSRSCRQGNKKFMAKLSLMCRILLEDKDKLYWPKGYLSKRKLPPGWTKSLEKANKYGDETAETESIYG